MGESAGGGLLFYLVGYSLMNLAAFGVINVLGQPDGEDADDINRYAGLSRRQPAGGRGPGRGHALAGRHPAHASGFMAKFYLFAAVVQAGLVPLAVIGVINSLISVYYYLRVIVVMYMKDAETDSYVGIEWVSVVTAGALAALVLYLGIRPDAFHAAAVHVVQRLSF